MKQIISKICKSIIFRIRTLFFLFFNNLKKKYKVAGWAPVAEGASGEPIWDLVATYLRSKKVIKPVKLNLPIIKGMQGNRGIA